MVLWLTQAAFSEDPGSVPSVHIVTHKHLKCLVPEDLTPGLGDAHDMYLKVSDRAGEMAQWSRALAALPEIQVQFLAPIQQYTPSCNSSSRGSNTLTQIYTQAKHNCT